jgi:hypothetical protein
MSRHRDLGRWNPESAVTVGLLRIELGLPARSPEGGRRHDAGDPDVEGWF